MFDFPSPGGLLPPRPTQEASPLVNTSRAFSIKAASPVVLKRGQKTNEGYKLKDEKIP